MAYKSKFEERVAEFYNLKDYETEYIEYTLSNRYTPDFKLGDSIYLETKGFFKASDRRKMLEVKKQHPHLKIILFFQNSKVRLGKRSKTTYGDWCDKNGIEWFCWEHKKPTKRILNMVARTSSD